MRVCVFGSHGEGLGTFLVLEHTSEVVLLRGTWNEFGDG